MGLGLQECGSEPLHPEILLGFHFPNALSEWQGSMSTLRTSLTKSSTTEGEIPNTAGGWLAVQETEIWKQASQQCVGSVSVQY